MRNATGMLFVVVGAPLVGCADLDESAADGGFAGRPWRAIEAVRIGATDDPVYSLTLVVSAAVGPDGSLFTLHRQAPFVRKWSPDGRHLGDIGREGEGPGEFQRGDNLGFHGDSLWVFDGDLRRLSWFSAEGTFLGSVSAGSGGIDLGMRPHDRAPVAERPLGDGTWLGSIPGTTTEITEGTMTRDPHVRMSADGRVLDTVWIRRPRDGDLHRTLAVQWGTGGSYSRQPLADHILTALDAPRGAFYLVERWAAPEGASEAEWTVRRLSTSGDTVWSRSFAYRPVPVPGSFIDSVSHEIEESVASMLRQFGRSTADVPEQVRDALYRPAHYPPVEALHAGGDGTVWIRVRDDTPDTDLWWVLAEDGSGVAQLHLPEGVRPLAADGRTLWGTLTDELDVPYLLRYELTSVEAQR